MPLDIKSLDRYKKITDYTNFYKQTSSKSTANSPSTQNTKAHKRPISPNQPELTPKSVPKKLKSSTSPKMDDNMVAVASSSLPKPAECIMCGMSSGHYENQ